MSDAIDPKDKGKFKEWAKKNGFNDTKSAALAVLRNPTKYSEDIRKQANYAANMMGVNPNIKGSLKKDIKAARKAGDDKVKKAKADAVKNKKSVSRETSKRSNRMHKLRAKYRT